jgi:hypothetical protein
MSSSNDAPLTIDSSEGLRLFEGVGGLVNLQPKPHVLTIGDANGPLVELEVMTPFTMKPSVVDGQARETWVTCRPK